MTQGDGRGEAAKITPTIGHEHHNKVVGRHRRRKATIIPNFAF